MKLIEYIYALIGQILFAIIVGSIAGPFHTVLFTFFPTAIRYTGICFNFSIRLAIFGGSSSLITSSITYYSGDVTYASLYLSFSGIIGLCALYVSSLICNDELCAC